ncbi:pyruvate, phosphate dikinase [Patescibacteria group bacterium]
MTEQEKYVYFFGQNKTEGNRKMKLVLGGKGANLAEMSNLGIPVPPGFTLSTKVCQYYYDHKQKYPATLKTEISRNLKKLEQLTGKSFGDPKNPLLLSVRSGAAVSMPGMMDTVLNLGLNPQTIEGLSKQNSNPRFVWDAYRRLIQMFGNVVDGIDSQKFEHALNEVKKTKGIKNDTQLNIDDLKNVVKKYENIYQIEKGTSFPSNPQKQLEKAIDAVFKSWNNQRAISYRQINKIDEAEVFGTAVNIQSMVFGNLNNDSGTGVAFTRNPSTGQKGVYGEFLMNAQGEDVVAGIRTPKLLTSLAKENKAIYQQLLKIFKKLEKHYREMQDIEFTIENKVLYILQTRTGKRTAPAAVKIAVEMVKEKLISRKIALLRVEADSLNQLLHPSLDPNQKKKFKLLAKGLPASPGAVSGQAVFTAEDAVEANELGDKVILVRTETSPEDIAGMNAALGILTSRGGMTSHAAVVARGMGKSCVAGCEDILVSEKNQYFNVGKIEVKKGDLITLDGATGEVYLGQIPTVKPTMSSEFSTLMSWADSYRKLGVRTNADTPKDAQVARDFGAEGIGLCRTEHMFFEEDRIFAVRQMILSKNKAQREKALSKIFPMQKNDFKQLFEIMKGLPVKIRLLDPPLHEFLPQEDRDIKALAKELKLEEKQIRQSLEQLHETNPMMGHRGCRLGISYPEIYQMQVRAIIEAACELKKKKKMNVVPEIMIPLVGSLLEFKVLKEELEPIIIETIKKYQLKLKYEIGTMIEIPRAALIADSLAQEAEFYSFGTNDLTQMTLGFSRDDSGRFIKDYLDKKVFKVDPFQTVDQKGVGKLMEMTVKLGRKVRKNMSIGICGEQGGEPKTIEFCHQINLSYVSCSPYRVPIARLSAAQASLKKKL